MRKIVTPWTLALLIRICDLLGTIPPSSWFGITPLSDISLLIQIHNMMYDIIRTQKQLKSTPSKPSRTGPPNLQIFSLLAYCQVTHLFSKLQQSERHSCSEWTSDTPCNSGKVENNFKPKHFPGKLSRLRYEDRKKTRIRRKDINYKLHKCRNALFVL